MVFKNIESSGREITETIPPKEIAFAFIKPQFLKHLDEIEEILNENDLEIIHADKVSLSGGAVDYVYADQEGENYFPIMKDHLTNNDSVVLLVSGGGDKTQEILSGLKKRTDGKPGIIREKFQDRPFLSEEEKEKWERGEHEKQDETTVLLTQSNVIHTADTPEEALKSLEIILGPKFEIMKKKGNLPAELWEIFE